jgi:hypothetical protein
MKRRTHHEGTKTRRFEEEEKAKVRKRRENPSPSGLVVTHIFGVVDADIKCGSIKENRL